MTPYSNTTIDGLNGFYRGGHFAIEDSANFIAERIQEVLAGARRKRAA